MMTVVWLASLAMRDASVVDVFWGLGLVVVAWIYLAARETRTLRGDFVVGLVTLWGLRLSLHILWRGRGRARTTATARCASGTRGRFLSGVSSPCSGSRPAGLAPLDVPGLALFTLGFVFEAGGDWQLARFKRDPVNAARGPRRRGDEGTGP